jgi:hypothetical protein
MSAPSPKDVTEAVEYLRGLGWLIEQYEFESFWPYKVRTPYWSQNARMSATAEDILDQAVKAGFSPRSEEGEGE